MKKIKTALIGYGLSGSVFHGPILKCHEGFDVHTIFVRDPEKRSTANRDFPEAHVTSDLTSIIENTEIDLVVICSPNTEHVELGIQMLTAGKHILVEKPFTVTVEEAETLTNLAKSKNLKLGIYHNRRFDGDFLTVQQLVEKKAFGRLTAYESHFDRYRPAFKDNSWREKNIPGSGVLYDLGSHLIDQALCLFGMPEELYADLSKERLGEADDAFELLLYYPDFKATLKASALIKEPTPRFALYGTDGAYVKYGMDPQEEALKSGHLPNTPHWGEEDSSAYGVLNHSTAREYIPTLSGSYLDFYTKVYEAIEMNGEMPVTGEDGIRVIRIIEAALKSHRLKTRIHL